MKPKIRELREEKHWSQKYLAEVLGVGQNTLSRWERGAYYPSLAYLYKLEEVFECRLKDLYTPD